MKFKVDGTEYEMPSLDSLTMDETIMLERHSGMTLESFQPGDDLPMGAVKGLIVIGIMRANPAAKERDISAQVGAIKMAELDELAVPEEGADPLADSSETEPEPSSEISGTDGPNGSAPTPEVLPLHSSGRQPSATGATSDPQTLAG